MWQRTIGKTRGAYLRAGVVELYVRQDMAPDGLPAGTWRLYVDGRLEGRADGELTAKAAAELASRALVVGADAASVAAAADEAHRAA